MCMNVLPACTCVHHAHAGWIPWNNVTGGCVLSIEGKVSGGAPRPLHH